MRQKLIDRTRTIREPSSQQHQIRNLRLKPNTIHSGRVRRRLAQHTHALLHQTHRLSPARRTHRQLNAQQLLLQLISIVNGVRERDRAQPIRNQVVLMKQTRAQYLARVDLARARLRTRLVFGEQRFDHFGLFVLVSKQIRLKTVQNRAAQVKRLLLVDHRHEQDDYDGPRRAGLHHDRRKELLIGRIASNHFGHGADDLAQEVGRDARLHEHRAQAMQEPEMVVGFLAVDDVLLLIGRLDEATNELEEKAQVFGFLCGPNEGAGGVRVELERDGLVGGVEVEVFADAFDVAALFEEDLVGVVVVEEVEEEVEAVLDDDAAFERRALAVDDLDELVEDALEGDDLLEVGVGLG